jgi:hypothetical protein
MKRSLICVHCGTAVAVEPRRDPVRTRLGAHLLNAHCELAVFEQVPRWAELLEHFFVLPLRTRSLPPLCTPDASPSNTRTAGTRAARA